MQPSLKILSVMRNKTENLSRLNPFLTRAVGPKIQATIFTKNYKKKDLISSNVAELKKIRLSAFH